MFEGFIEGMPKPGDKYTVAVFSEEGNMFMKFRAVIENIL